MRLAIKNSDYLGAFTATLCMLHCFATPFLFITQAHSSTLAHDIPFYWQLMNYLFILISLVAVSASIKNSTKLFVKILLFSFWFLLSFLIINEGLEGFHIPEFYTYIAATSLSFLHIYNLKYCTCKEECCTNEK